MNKQLLRNLAREIVSKNGLKRAQAKKLVEVLSSQDLKILMQMIILEEKKQTANIVTVDELSKSEKETLGKIFRVKKVVTSVDKKIGGGIKAQVYDMIYDLSVKSKFKSIAEELEKEL